MRRSVYLAQLFIILSLVLQAVHYYFFQPIPRFWLFISLFSIGFLPALFIDFFFPKWTKYVFVICAIFIVSVSYSFVDYPIVQATYFFLPVTAILVNDRYIYYLSCLGGFISYILLTHETGVYFFTFLSLFLIYCLLLYLAQLTVYQNITEITAVRQGVKAFSLAVEAKDFYTQGHSRRVAKYSVILARHGKFKEVDIKELELTALIHDIGKISTPDRVLMKNGKLTIEEYEIMKKHPVDGMVLARSFGYSAHILEGILHHHERYDGNGYPFQLAGEDIPLFSRILAVADSFDAMTSNRAYRNAMTPWEAKKEIEINSGKMYDPEIVAVFLKAFSEMLIVCEENKDILQKEALAISEVSSS